MEKCDYAYAVTHMAMQYCDLISLHSVRSPSISLLLRYLRIEEHPVIFLLSVCLLVIARYSLMPRARTRSVQCRPVQICALVTLDVFCPFQVTR